MPYEHIAGRHRSEGQRSLGRIRVGGRLHSIGDTVLVSTIIRLQQIFVVGELIDIYLENRGE